MKYLLFISLGILMLISGHFQFEGSRWLAMASSNENNLFYENKVDSLKLKQEPVLDHTNWDKLLKKYVSNNGDVDYKGFLKDHKKLKDYLAYLSKHEPEKSWSVEKQLSYHINLYNAYTIDLILENYPVESIKDIKGAWINEIVKIGNTRTSLGDLENDILRKMDEPRIHFAINCAAVSCPKLLNEAFTAKDIERQLEKATFDFINSDENIIKENRAQLSRMFQWYENDYFTGDISSIREYINQYSKVKIAPEAEITYKEYDWSLNEQ